MQVYFYGIYFKDKSNFCEFKGDAVKITLKKGK